MLSALEELLATLPDDATLPVALVRVWLAQLESREIEAEFTRSKRRLR